MFLSIVRTSRAALREQVPTDLVLLIAYAVLYAASYFWALYEANLHASESSVVAHTIAFPNSAAVGSPLLASAFG
jgi:malonate transporter and related proteins